MGCSGIKKKQKIVWTRYSWGLAAGKEKVKLDSTDWHFNESTVGHLVCTKRVDGKKKSYLHQLLRSWFFFQMCPYRWRCRVSMWLFYILFLRRKTWKWLVSQWVLFCGFQQRQKQLLIRHLHMTCLNIKDYSTAKENILIYIIRINVLSHCKSVILIDLSFI